MTSTKTSPRGSENSSRENSSPKEKLTSDPSSTSTLPTSKDSPSAISFAEFWGGSEHSSLQASPPLGECGACPAPANLSPQRASKKAKQMSGISGPLPLNSSASVALSLSLGSKLQTLLGTGGLMEYRQTWNLKTTPAGRQYWAHTASAHRTSDKGSTGWPTPTALDRVRDEETLAKCATFRKQNANQNTVPLYLGEVAALTAGWPTPQVFDGTNNGEPRPPRYKGNAPSEVGNLRRKDAFGSYRGDLKDWVPALIAGWATPDANAMNLGEGLETWDARQAKNKAKHGNGNGAGMPIAVQALTTLPSGGWSTSVAGDKKCRICNPNMAHTASAHRTSDKGSTGWPTPTARDHKDGSGQSCANVPSNCLLGREVHLTSGATTDLSPAVMAKRGALNPALSRWLMGYPVEWCQSAIAAFRKLKRQPKRGSCDSKGTAMPSSPKRQRSSSSPPKQPDTTELKNFWS